MISLVLPYQNVGKEHFVNYINEKRLSNQHGWLGHGWMGRESWIVDRPFSIMLVKLPFNATRNSRIKLQKMLKQCLISLKKCHLNSKRCFALFQTKRTNSYITVKTCV